jgi:predicted nucleic acid-binding Zn ribbon protein
MAGIPPHKHCLVCGNAIREDENFCDELCESKYKSAQKRQQILLIVFIVLMGLIVLMPALMSMMG